jgi:hypothetical protein
MKIVLDVLVVNLFLENSFAITCRGEGLLFCL